jgi:hypothetical protein
MFTFVFIIMPLFFSFNFPVDEYEEECVPSGGFAYEKVSKNLHLISADTLFFQRLYANQPVRDSTREY